MIILKITKSQGLTFSLEDTFFEKPQGGQIDTPPIFTLVLCLKFVHNLKH